MQFPSSNEKGKVSDDAVSKLREFDGGTLDYNKQENVWKFVSGKTEIPIGIVSEGVRKMSVIERLLDVNYIKPGSIVIIDEIENSLHPKALCDFIDIVYQLSCNDIQFFISTHSYIAMKKFYVMAREKDISIPTVSLEDGAAICADLKDGLPEMGSLSIQMKYMKEKLI
jgi:AAA15 family ATPase/GTPase